MQRRPMTAANAIDPSHPPQASDLAPEISALIEAAIARAAGTTTIRRPEVRTVYWSVQEAPLRLPHLTAPKKRTRVIALGDLVLVGFFGGLLLATSSHFGFLGCGGVGWLGWGRLRRCSAGRARWRPSEGQGFRELGPGGEHNIGAQGLQVVEEAGSGSKRLAGVPPSA